MPATLEIRHILGSNPVWHRSNLGPMEELTQSIKVNGITTPLLVQADFLLIDGARRLVAAQSLGIKTVPIHICRTWEDVKKHFNPVAEDCHPMDWPDLIEFWYNVLNPIHKEVQRSKALATRRKGTSSGKRDVYSGFVIELAEIYNSTPSTVKTLRDYVRRIEAKKIEYPVFTKGAWDLLPTGKDARDLSKTRFIKMAMENLTQRNFTEEIALEVLKRRFNGELVHKANRVGTKAKITDSTVRSLDDVSKLVDLTENIAREAVKFQVFDLDAEQAVLAATRMQSALSDLGRMRRRLLAATTNGEGR